MAEGILHPAARAYKLTLRSSNSKTGPIPVSTSSSDTCPTSCPLLANNSCYAKHGPLAIQWRKVDRGEHAKHWGDFLRDVHALPDGQLWRHNQAGDLPGDGDEINFQMLIELVEANRGKRGFTYTHKPVRNRGLNNAIVRWANQNGFTINLSSNDLTEADRLAELDIGPVVTLLPSNAAKNETLETPDGRTVVPCPATYQDDVSCASCQLCQRQRAVIVGFPAHGSGKRRLNAALSGE